jgi:hypothetical protein
LSVAKLGLVKRERRKKEIEVLVHRILRLLCRNSGLVSWDPKSHFSGAMPLTEIAYIGKLVPS